MHDRVHHRAEERLLTALAEVEPAPERVVEHAKAVFRWHQAVRDLTDSRPGDPENRDGTS